MGDGITAPGGVWTFGGHTPAAFDAHVARSLPAYADCHDLIVDIAEELVPAGGRCYDIGCSTGTLTARLAGQLAPRAAEVVGVDREPGMISVAEQRFAGRKSLRFENAALEDLSLEPADLLVCFYTLQFVAPRRRQRILARMHDALAPHGALILFEKVLSQTARQQSVSDGVYREFKRRQGFGEGEIMAKTRSLRGVLQPLSAEQNYAMLDRAGFSEIVQVYRWMTFDGVVAYASSARPQPASVRK